MPQVVVSNRLTDGEVVFLAESGSWVESINASKVLETKEEAERMMEIARKSEAKPEVVDPYLIEVKLEDGAVVPVRYREVIRAAGPTNRLDLGKQSQR